MASKTRTPEGVSEESRNMDEGRDRAVAEVRALIYRTLTNRGATPSDADEAAQEALVRIWSSPQHLDKLKNLAVHRGYFVHMGYTCWLGGLRRERSRRAREERYVREEDHSVDSLGTSPRLFELAEEAQLTTIQLEYLRLLTEREMSIADIARQKGVTVRSVNRVVERARDHLRASIRE
jgi:DNA-directed RNA polymerase specialized sigma24 family protein